MFSDIKEVTDCDEPDLHEWVYSLNITKISLEPSNSASIKLTISSSCTCQVGCRANIAVKAISGGNPSVTHTVNTYTTRGPGDDYFGIKIEIDYNPYNDILQLETQMKFDVNIYNLQAIHESVLIWLTETPDNWSANISPTEFDLNPNSMRTVTLSFSLPDDVAPGEYTITLSARSQKSLNVRSTESIKILIKPDLIIDDLKFSKNELNAGEDVELTISVKNIGLVDAKDVTVGVYSALNYTIDHELGRKTIPMIAPNQVEKVKLNWRPQEGKFNVSIRIDPDWTLDELRSYNNFKMEPVTVGPSEDAKDDNIIFYVIILFLVIITLVCLIGYYKFHVGNTKQQQESSITKNNKSNLPLSSQVRTQAQAQVKAQAKAKAKARPRAQSQSLSQSEMRSQPR